MIDLPTDPLKNLPMAFRDYVIGRCAPPWIATASVLEYLRLDVMSIYVRGDASGGSPTEWYVQLTFSGCAGMAEVSSELAVHWAERWYLEKQAEITSKYLKPYGFEPSGLRLPDRSEAIFVPLGAAGYALFNPTPRPPDEESLESRYFDIDASALETISEDERGALMRRLDEDLPQILPAGSCCCQLCAPDFDASDCDRLVPFR
jgi:hypothetical protein